jgi:hypothetical protein
MHSFSATTPQSDASLHFLPRICNVAKLGFSGQLQPAASIISASMSMKNGNKPPSF